MAEFRREALQDFVDTTDGDTPPVYIGRQDILRKVEGYASSTWKGPGADVHGVGKATSVVQGAPGAGKSALIDELRERAATSAHLPERSRVLTLSSRDLVIGLPDVLELIGLAGGVSASIWEKLSTGLSLGVDLEAVKARANLSWSAPGSSHPENILSLARKFPAGKWQGPVIVCVDETQNLTGGKDTPHASFLQAVHEGRSSLPLSLVAVGLSDTADVLDGMGLTRLSVHPLGGLSTQPDPDRDGYTEVMDLMLSFCDHFGIGREGETARLMALAAPCEGWPRHLHYALQALGRGVLETAGDLATVDWPTILREAADSRQEYYRIQQNRDMKDSHMLVARILRDFRDGMAGSAVTDLIQRSVDDRPGLRLPEDGTPLGFRSLLVHRGALHMDLDGAYHCPIPSFRSFLVRAGGLGPERFPERNPTERDIDRDMDFSP